MPVTGDATQNNSYQTHASAIPFTIVPVALLGTASDPVNQAHLSGKQEGSGFVGDDFNLYIADGSAPTDVWHLAGAADALDDITPA